MVDTTAPAEVTGLAVTAKTTSSLTIGFIKPNDADYSKANVYVNGSLNGSTTGESYDVVGLTDDTAYTIVVKTVDTAGNKSVGVTVTGRTNAVVIPPVVDTTAPAEVTGLAVATRTTTSLTLGFVKPSDADYVVIVTPPTTNDEIVTIPTETPVAPPTTPTEPVKLPDPTPTPTIVFKDVQNHWAEESIVWATENGLVKGFDDGTFKPNAKVTEAQFLAMIIRIYNPEFEATSVVTNENWAKKYYDVAKSLNIPTFGNPNKAITRLQLAEIVAATRGYNLKGDNLVAFMYANGYANGSDPKKQTIASFNPNGQLTRAEAVQFLKNLADNFDGKLLKRSAAPSDTSALPTYPKK